MVSVRMPFRVMLSDSARIQLRLTWNANTTVGGMTAQGYRTDLEIECVGKAHSGDETQSIFAHLNIMHARLPGIRTHLEEAYKVWDHV